jgi:hypothetical protein
MEDLKTFLASVDWSPITELLRQLINAVVVIVAGYMAQQFLKLKTNSNLQEAAGRVVDSVTVQTGITVGEALIDPAKRSVLLEKVLDKSGSFADGFEKSFKRLGADQPSEAAKVLEKAFGAKLNEASKPGASNVVP